MTKPETISLKCTYCGHEWDEPLSRIKEAKVIIYRDGEETVRRRVKCPNCQRSLNVDIPKAWLENE